jgi:hypothetical protein
MEQEINSEKKPAEGTLYPILLIGLLSLLFGELFAGSTHIWFLDPWSIIVVIPLYLIHLLFFLKLAIKYKKTSPVHLYLFGTLFGMYESWLTQVLWFGYTNQAPMNGTIAGIAIGEFLVLVFFWHPIFSFMLPIYVYEILTLSALKNTDSALYLGVIIPSHCQTLVKSSFNSRSIIFFLCIGSVITAFNFGGQILHVLLTFIVTYGLIILLYKKSSEKQVLSIKSLELTESGFKKAMVYLILLYIIMFFVINLQGFPGLLGIVSVIVIYFIFAMLLKTSKESNESFQVNSDNIAQCYSEQDFKQFILMNLIGVSVVCIIMMFFTIIILVLFMFLYYLMAFVGCLVFIKSIKWRKLDTRVDSNLIAAKIFEKSQEKTPILLNKTICSQCGAKGFENGEIFCIECGNRL